MHFSKVLLLALSAVAAAQQSSSAEVVRTLNSLSVSTEKSRIY